MGNAESGSPVPVTGAAYLAEQARQQQYLSRTPPLRSPAQLVGPGIDAMCTTVTDWNSDITTYNGYYSMAAPPDAGTAAQFNAPAALNSSDSGGLVGILGQVISDGVFGGVQRLTPVGVPVGTFAAVVGMYWERQFVRSPLDPTTITWGAWTLIDPHAFKGQPMGALSTPKPTTIASSAALSSPVAMNGTVFGTSAAAQCFNFSTIGLHLINPGVYNVNIRVTTLNSFTWDQIKISYPLADGSINSLAYVNVPTVAGVPYTWNFILSTPNQSGIVQFQFQQTSGSAQNVLLLPEATLVGPFG